MVLFLSFFALLLTPGVHHKVSGNVLYKLDLHPDRHTQNRHSLAFFHILDSKLHHLLRLVKTVVVADGVVMYGAVKELGLYPTGANCHNIDAKLPKLNTQGSGKAEHLCLACTVNIDIGYRLPR